MLILLTYNPLSPFVLLWVNEVTSAISRATRYLGAAVDNVRFNYLLLCSFLQRYAVSLMLFVLSV